MYKVPSFPALGSLPLHLLDITQRCTFDCQQSRVRGVAILLLCDAFHIPDVVQCTVKCWQSTVPLDCSCTGQCFSLNCEVLAAEEAVITGHAVPTPFILKHHHHHINSAPSNYYSWFEFLSTYHQAWITQYVSNPSFLSLTCKMFSEIFLQSYFFAHKLLLMMKTARQFDVHRRSIIFCLIHHCGTISH